MRTAALKLTDVRTAFLVVLICLLMGPAAEEPLQEKEGGAATATATAPTGGVHRQRPHRSGNGARTWTWPTN